MTADELRPPGADRGWHSGRIELRPVTDTAETLWAAGALGSVSVPGLRIAQPARATDGRQVVGGWKAYRTADGDAATAGEARAAPSFDDIVLISVKLHQAVAHLPRPDFIGKRTDLLAVADRIAWGEETDIELDEHQGGRWFEILIGSAKRVSLPDQVVHGSLYTGVRFSQAQPPTVIDFRPYYRPAEWATALVVVDAITFGGADAALMERWAHLPAWRQMLLRAVLFRLAAHALDLRPDGGALDRLRHAAAMVSRFV